MNIEFSSILDHDLLNVLHRAHDQVVAIEQGPKIAQKLPAVVLFNQRVHLKCRLGKVQSNAYQRLAMLHCTQMETSAGDLLQRQLVLRGTEAV